MNFESSWLLIPLWILLFVLDNYLTVIVSRRYQTQDPQIIEFQGGYELTPQFKQEITRGQMFGPRFLRNLVIFTAVILLVRYLVTLGWFSIAYYQFLMGTLILLSCAVNIRHAQNMVFFGLIPVLESPIGKIVYPSSFSYRGSAIGFLSFSLFYLLLSGVQMSLFVLGGAFGCLVIAISHWRLSNRTHKENDVAH
ncbi:MAG: hypothetical protein PVG04_04210 [Anaerolineales bacterium]|jgi:hypothetical protein